MGGASMSFSLGSFAGGAAQGYQSEQQIAMQRALQAQNYAADTAAGNALGGTSAPLQQQNPLQALLGRLGVSPQQPAPAPQQGGAPPMGGNLMPQMAMSGGGQAQPPAPQQPQQGGQPAAPQPQQISGQPIGQLTLDNVVQRIKSANPNISPRDLMGAVGKILPVMNAQSQMQYKQIMEQLAPKRFDEISRHNRATEGLGEKRAEQGDRRLNQGDAALDERKREFDTRLEERKREFEATTKEKYDALQSTKDSRQAALLATNIRAAIKDKFARTRDAINASFVSDSASHKQLMAQAAADRDEATARLDSALAAQKAFADQNSSDARPVSRGIGGVKNQDRAGSLDGGAPAAQPADTGPQMLDENTMRLGGKTFRYTGKGDRDARESWVEVTDK